MCGDAENPAAQVVRSCDSAVASGLRTQQNARHELRQGRNELEEIFQVTLSFGHFMRRV